MALPLVCTQIIPFFFYTEAFAVCENYSPPEGFNPKDLHRLLEKVGSPSGADDLGNIHCLPYWHLHIQNSLSCLVRTASNVKWFIRFAEKLGYEPGDEPGIGG